MVNGVDAGAGVGVGAGAGAIIRIVGGVASGGLGVPSSSLWLLVSSMCCTASKVSAICGGMSHERAAALLVCMGMVGGDSPV